jgi:hypothetical protein
MKPNFYASECTGGVSFAIQSARRPIAERLCYAVAAFPMKVRTDKTNAGLGCGSHWRRHAAF